MDWDEAKKIFSEQLQLLAERAKSPDCTTEELCKIVSTTADAIKTIFL